jgi:hypothetical protein
MPDLQKRNALTNEQTSYELTLDVRATDSNVQTATARVGTFKDGALTFRVVPNDVLQVLIAREEREQGDKLEDAIKKLETQLGSLREMSSRLPTLSADTTISEQTRIENILDTVAKQKEAVTTIAETFGRLIDEYKVNRFSKDMTNGLTENVKIPLEKTTVKEFPEADDTLNNFLASLKGVNANAAIQAYQPAVDKVHALIERLRFLRNAMGAELRFNEAIGRVKKSAQNQQAIQQALKDIEDQYFKDLLWIQLKGQDTVTVSPKKKTNVRFAIRMPNSINVDPPKLTLSVVEKDSGIQVPATVLLKQFGPSERSAIDFELNAGEKTGDFTLRIEPTQGPVVEVKVVVK